MSSLNNNDASNVQLSAQFSEIQQQLGQLGTQLTAVKTQLEQLPSLYTRVARIEQSLLLVADVHRYGKLQHYLTSDHWFEADKETIQLIMDIAGQSDLEELSPADIKNFPCNGLRVIDQLWRTHSNGRFGFSVQLQVYQSLGGTLETTIEQNTELVETWGDRLGWRENNRWRKCDELDYSLAAPVGCHPSRWWNSPYGSKMTNYFLGRLMTCEL